MKAAILILSVILSITVKVHCLQCYMCYDCEKATDDYLVTCQDSASNSTMITSSTTESATNSSSTTTSTTTLSTNTTSSTTTPTTSTSTTAPDSNATDTNDTSKIEANMYESVERASSYECFSGTINVSNTTVTVRGCTVNPTNNSCAVSGLSDCKLCSTDKCNSATAVHSSAALLCLLFVALVFKD